jgi:hypothetical protein
MKLIDYEKYKNVSSRSSVLSAVVEALSTGVLIGLCLIEAFRGRDFWQWAWMLAICFSSAVGALRGTLIALHKCPGKTTDEAAPEQG